MEFDIEQALIASLDPGPNQQVALDYLNKISENPSIFQSIIDIFFRVSEERVRFLLSFVIYRLLDTSFSAIDEQLIINFRNNIIDFLFNEKINNSLCKQIEMIISIIAFNQWPEVWANFISDIIIISQKENILENLPKVFHILENLIVSFSKSQFLSLLRMNFLIQELQFKIPDIISLLQSIPFDQVIQSQIGPSFVSFIRLYCKLKLDDPQICYNLAAFLYENFAPYIPFTFESLTNLISKSRIDVPLFNLSIRNIIQLIDKPLTDLDVFISFICHIVKVSIPLLPQCCVDPNFFPMIRFILGYALSNSSQTEFCEDIWSLWSVLLNMYAESAQLKTSAVYLMLEPILPTVLESLFERLPTAMSQSRLSSFQPISCIVAFTMIDENKLLSFLSEKAVSPSLLIALGTIHFLNDNPMLDSILMNIIPPLLSGRFADDLNSSLFVISRSTEFLSHHIEFLSETIKLFSNLLVSDDFTIAHTLLLALNHISSQIPQLIALHCPEFLVFLVENVFDPIKFQIDDFFRVCRIISKLFVCDQNRETKQHVAEVITTSVSGMLASNDKDTLWLGCKSLIELVSASSKSVNEPVNSPFANLFYEPIFVALSNTKESDMFSIVCDCFSLLARSSDSFEKCSGPISSFSLLIESVQNQEYTIVHTFSRIRLKYNEMDAYRQTIMDSYIRKMVENHVLAIEFFEFFDSFNILESEQEIVIPAACEAIKCLDFHISKSAIVLLLKRFKESAAPFQIPCEFDVISSIFDALFDQVHHQCMKKLLRLLHQVVDKLHKRQIPYEECLFNSIRSKVCDDELSKNIVTALKNSVTKELMFIELVQNLLIATGRANPNEFQMLSDIVSTRIKSMIPRQGFFHNEDEIGKS